VKICGITNWDDAKLSVDLGADALGFNFYPPSPRSIAPAAAWQIIRRLPPLVAAVGVFVNWPAEAVIALAKALRLDAVQLHGDESPEVARTVSGAFKIVRAIAVGPSFRLASLKRYPTASAFLLDGFRSGLYGGTGATADWKTARAAKRYGRVILAGGIRPENVGRAIREVRPFAVDVASGVEARPGKKDAAALRELMRQVEAANRSKDE
jgi:phosphoribosylanthranilate isomerase